MSTAEDRTQLQVEYEQAAQEYLHSLPLEHFMESTDQARQREITVESFALLHRARPEIHYFNEPLVQYPVAERRRPQQVVPDNMVVRCADPIEAGGSYNVPFQPVGPFWVLEYVSKGNERKDYEDSFQKYEQELKVPYYLIFYPQTQDLTLYWHNGSKYVTVTPNAHGRYAIAELDVEVGLLEEWVRYWYRGKLLPLPAELAQSLEEANGRAVTETRLREQAERSRVEAVELARDAQRRTEEQTRLAIEAHDRAEVQARLAVEERRRGEEQARQLEQERQARLALEQRLAQLQALLAQRPPDQTPNP